ncbi:MAG: hypothetical protein J6D28_01110 [Bacilli bacterium]|nr:hypothetical protein [Bacilli bacterium]
MDYMNKWIEEKILRKPRNYEDYPNQMKKSLQSIIEKHNLEIFVYEKSNYNLYAILKDKLEDRYVCIRANDLRCFIEPSYKNIYISAMKNPKIEIHHVGIVTNWNDIGINARRLMDFKKKLDLSKEEKVMDEEIEKDI